MMAIMSESFNDFICDGFCMIVSQVPINFTISATLIYPNCRRWMAEIPLMARNAGSLTI